MDIVHHAAIGGIGFGFLAANNQEIAGAAFMGATVFPDLDVFFMVLGKRFYLKKHQGTTHSVAMSPLFAFLLSMPLIYFFGFDLVVIGAALAGLWLHTFLDLTNTFGNSLFWPFTSRRYSCDAIFFIDLYAWIITCFFYVSSHFLNVRIAFYLYMSLFTLYVVFRLLLHRYVKLKLRCKVAVPSSVHLFEFFILEEAGPSMKTYQYNVISARSKNVEYFDLPPKRYEEMAQKSRVFNDLTGITKYLHITDASEDERGTTIIARDLGIRNFGGKFGTTTLRFDREGELVDEVAHI